MGWGDDQWERTEELLTGRSESIGCPAEDNRRFVEAVPYRYRAEGFRGVICQSVSATSA
jgi:hypothetical protein